MPDQIVQGQAPLPAQYNFDSTANGTVYPLPDGTQTEFNLSAVPVSNSLVLCLNGLIESGYTILPGLLTVVFSTSPPAGSLLTARYQVS